MIDNFEEDLKKVGNPFVQSCHFCQVGWIEAYILYARDIPGDGHHFFHAQAFLCRIAANWNAISFTKQSQQPSSSNSDCKLCTAPINIKPKPVTVPWLEVFEEVPHYLQFCNILGTKSNKPQNRNLAHIYISFNC